jgi:N6-L-threonylcarbamoyladenine synthase
MGPVIARALDEAGLKLADLDAIVVTAGPGLVGALLVGVMYGKALSLSLGIPLLGVNHLEGHLFAPTLEDPEFRPPFIGLLVSGGHTMLLDVPAWGDYRLLGATRDDAAGEAFDKVATMLGLGYPGGPQIERLAREGRADRYDFPRPMLGALDRAGLPEERYAFSFSGLKTAVLRAARGATDLEAERRDLARGFQDAVLDVLTAKTAAAVDESGYSVAMVGGGVACNRALAERMRRTLGEQVRVSIASNRLNTDNAAMIAAAGAWRLARGERSGFDLEPMADLPMPGLTTRGNY